MMRKSDFGGSGTLKRPGIRETVAGSTFWPAPGDIDVILK